MAVLAARVFQAAPASSRGWNEPKALSQDPWAPLPIRVSRPSARSLPWRLDHLCLTLPCRTLACQRPSTPPSTLCLCPGGWARLQRLSFPHDPAWGKQCSHRTHTVTSTRASRAKSHLLHLPPNPPASRDHRARDPSNGAHFEPRTSALP